MLYRFLAFIFLMYFKLFHRLRIEGVENVPKNGAVIFCPNHIHNLDPPAIAASIYRIRVISFMAKEELFLNRWVASFLRNLNAFPVKRGGADRQALKQAMQLLRTESAVGIFPEGTRSKDGNISEGSSGAAMLALKTAASVIPVGIIGDYKIFKPLVIRFGQAVDIDEYRKEKISADDAKGAISLVMNDIRSLTKK